MPSNDERRQVAARLRDYATRDFEESNPWWYLSKAVTGSFAAYDDVGEYFTDLADLIEPEPERTCRVERRHVGPLYIVYKFSCCEEEWVESNTDQHASAIDETVCPRCGARVIE